MTLAENLARIIALHGLGTVSGVDRQTAPSPEWDMAEYRARILEIIPGAAEAKCRALAAEILEAIFSFSNERETDDGIRTVPGYAAEIIRKKEPGMVGLILNLDRLQDVLDARAAREVVSQGIEASGEDDLSASSRSDESPVGQQADAPEHQSDTPHDQG